MVEKIGHFLGIWTISHDVFFFLIMTVHVEFIIMESLYI